MKKHVATTAILMTVLGQISGCASTPSQPLVEKKAVIVSGKEISQEERKGNIAVETGANIGVVNATTLGGVVGLGLLGILATPGKETKRICVNAFKTEDGMLGEYKSEITHKYGCPVYKEGEVVRVKYRGDKLVYFWSLEDEVKNEQERQKWKAIQEEAMQRRAEEVGGFGK